jgi:hypothetical protein
MRQPGHGVSGKRNASVTSIIIVGKCIEQAPNKQFDGKGIALMDSEHFEKIILSLNRIAAATLAASIIEAAARKPTLKEAQTAFNNCYMIVAPELGTKKQTDFQENLDKKMY